MNSASCRISDTFNYFQSRSKLFNLKSNFSCFDQCRGKCCQDKELLIKITVLDLISASLVTNLKPSEIYNRFCSLSLFSARTSIPFQETYIRRLRIKLKMPCGFLKGKDCTIYPGRPIACALFPEDRYTETLLEEKSWGYPCVSKPVRVSPERKHYLLELTRISAEESLVSDFYLFGCSPFYITIEDQLELINIAQELKEQTKSSFKGEKKRYVVPQKAFEILLEKYLQGSEFQKEIEEMIKRLDKIDGIEEVFRLKEVILPLKDHPEFTRTVFLHEIDKNRKGFRLTGR